MRNHRHAFLQSTDRGEWSQKLSISPLTPLVQMFSDLRIFSNFLLSELIHDWNYRTCDKWKYILKEIFLCNLSDFHAEIVRIFSKKYLKDLQGDSFLYLFYHLFLKIGLTVAVLACLEYLFEDISLLIILAK